MNVSEYRRCNKKKDNPEKLATGYTRRRKPKKKQKQKQKQKQKRNTICIGHALS